MLNAETKRKIKNARDVLVGKIPVPTAQVEQITLALMFKFMGDMDERAERLGDKTGFFQGEYSKYSWKNVVDPTLSAEERVNLYSEALEKMNNNPNVPQLFRDVFKGAFLPFRDPETLKLFLAEINEIEYTHSEDLGDAYEHLLSVMGSQGDAGQFRTPRHIIDFIVEIVDPKKEDRVLDPACGTAGFLISAYKHILKENTTKDSKVLGDALSSMDRRSLTENFVGYDISHEMRRLSLVNMYLHQFRDPQIYEYDTLTSLDHWDEDFDCILANPPFMTPKGGIRPHNRFSVKSNRAEVLFVDYIMSHLSTTGKAGIIVPEGIIFQSANAYKSLRKLLVDDNYLWGVISLPQGVFNPYAGVKTSVLLLDKNIAKKTDNILFVNVENDGFDLGAQRKKIEENDLPKILESLRKYKESILDEKEIKEEELFKTHMVEKSKIKESGDYNLSGNRYQSSKREIYVKGKWEMVELGELCDIKNGSTPSKSRADYWEGGTIPWFTIEDIREQGRVIRDTKQKITENALKETSVKLLPSYSVLLCCTASVGECAFTNIPLSTNQQFNGLIIKDSHKDKILPKFLFWMCTDLKGELERVSGKTSFNFVSVKTLSKIKIPLPPIEEQKRIVEELDRYQRIIDGARMVIDNWKPEIEIDSEWKMVRLGSVFKTSSGGTPLRSVKEYYKDGRIPWLRSGEISQGLIQKSELCITKKGLENSSAKLFPINTVLVAMYGATAGEVGILKFESALNQAVCGIYPTKDYVPEFLFLVLSSLKEKMKELSVGGAQPNISQKIIKDLLIPLVDLDLQRELVKDFYKELEVIEANKKLLEKTEAKVRDRIEGLF